MNRLVPVNSTGDIFPHIFGTPPGLLLEYHNLGRLPERYDTAQMLVGMCIDNRKHLRIPDSLC
jgi:carbonic anhydrase